MAFRFVGGSIGIFGRFFHVCQIFRVLTQIKIKFIVVFVIFNVFFRVQVFFVDVASVFINLLDLYYSIIPLRRAIIVRTMILDFLFILLLLFLVFFAIFVVVELIRINIPIFKALLAKV